jgi:myosin-5
MKSSTGTSEAIPTVSNAPNLGIQKDFEHWEKLQRAFNQKFQVWYMQFIELNS